MFTFATANGCFSLLHESKGLDGLLSSCMVCMTRKLSEIKAHGLKRDSSGYKRFYFFFVQVHHWAKDIESGDSLKALLISSGNPPVLALLHCGRVPWQLTSRVLALGVLKRHKTIRRSPRVSSGVLRTVGSFVSPGCRANTDLQHMAPDSVKAFPESRPGVVWNIGIRKYRNSSHFSLWNVGITMLLLNKRYPKSVTEQMEWLSC